VSLPLGGRHGQELLPIAQEMLQLMVVRLGSHKASGPITAMLWGDWQCRLLQVTGNDEVSPGALLAPPVC